MSACTCNPCFMAVIITSACGLCFRHGYKKYYFLFLFENAISTVTAEKSQFIANACLRNVKGFSNQMKSKHLIYSKNFVSVLVMKKILI